MPVQEMVLSRTAEVLTRQGDGPAVHHHVAAGGDSERVFELSMKQAGEEMAPQRLEASGRVQEPPRLHGSHGVGMREDESAGDAILGGLRSIRGMFDEQVARAAELARTKSASNPTDLILTQMEVTRLTLMIDVTSKLAGKCTQSCDTLLKG